MFPEKKAQNNPIAEKPFPSKAPLQGVWGFYFSNSQGFNPVTLLNAVLK